MLFALDPGEDNREHRPDEPARGKRWWTVGMHASPFPSSVLRAPSPDATCTCEHWLHCNCDCHGINCDPTEATCDVAYVADEGGLTRWGCPDCTPGDQAPHVLGCELIGWNVPMPEPIAYRDASLH